MEKYSLYILRKLLCYTILRFFDVFFNSNCPCIGAYLIGSYLISLVHMDLYR